MIVVLDSRAMRAADAAAIRAGVPSRLLMENAATALADQVIDSYPLARRAAVVCGPGNNGGDGLAAARLLAHRGRAVAVFTLSDPALYRGDAAENAVRAGKSGLALQPLTSRSAWSRLSDELTACDVVVDALFGTGLSRGLSGASARAVSIINAAGRPVVSADLPSGLSADSGRLLGPSVIATWTVAFAAAKYCHVLSPARERCGRVAVRDIGISRQILDRRKSNLSLLESRDVTSWLPARPLDSHKGDFGRLAVVAGSRGKTGAAILTARGALRAGAGLVTVFCPASVERVIVAALPEAMTHGLAERDGGLSSDAAGELLAALSDFDSVAAGPGLGTSPGTKVILQAILKTRLKVVCDADALNAFAGRLQAFRRGEATVLTPHPGEAARLLGCSIREIQADRLASVRALARKSGSVVVLKGFGTLIATSSGRVVANPTGSPIMATAGAGDVLTGAVGALLASGMAAESAAAAAAYLHGAAGERIARRLGDAGMLASELADELPRTRRALRASEDAGNR